MTKMDKLQIFQGRLRPNESARFDHEFEKPIRTVSTSCNCTSPKYSPGLPVFSVTLVAPYFSEEFKRVYSQEELENGFDMSRSMVVTFDDNSSQEIELNFTLFL